MSSRSSRKQVSSRKIVSLRIAADAQGNSDSGAATFLLTVLTDRVYRVVNQRLTTARPAKP